MLLSLTLLALLAPQTTNSTLDALLLSAPPERRQAAFDEVARSGDRRYLPVLVDLLRFADTRAEWFNILESASSLLDEDVTQLERPWYHLSLRLASDAQQPFFADYARWKGTLLAQKVDPRFADFLHEGVDARVRLDEVVWGGVAVGGIPALTDPELLEAKAATWLADEEPVFGIAIGTQQRAYPLRIVDWHEMVNDVIDGVPVALAYCTL